MAWAAIGVTLRLAVATTAVLLVVGVPLAYWLATTRWRGRFIVDAVVSLPIVLPPTVVGFYLLMATGPHSPAGRALEAVFGHAVPFSFAGILIGSVVFNLPFAVRPFTSALAAVNGRLVESSWCLGASRARTFFRILLPLARTGILTGVILVFAHSVGEFGVVLMLGGNIPGVTQTISTLIYDDVQAMDYAAAHQTAFVLLLFALAALCAVHALQRRTPAP
jgi:molybdate transport system permease protein